MSMASESVSNGVTAGPQGSGKHPWGIGRIVGINAVLFALFVAGFVLVSMLSRDDVDVSPLLAFTAYGLGGNLLVAVALVVVGRFRQAVGAVVSAVLYALIGLAMVLLIAMAYGAAL